MQKIRGVVSGRETSTLIQKEVLILSDEERQSFLLDKAGISSSIELGAAEVLAIKAGLAIPCVTWDMHHLTVSGTMHMSCVNFDSL